MYGYGRWDVVSYFSKLSNTVLSVFICSPEPRGVIGELDCIETLLRIVQDYDTLSKK